MHRAVALALALTASARAQDVPVIDVQAPAECTFSQALVERTRAMLDGEIRADAQVSIDPGGHVWEADVVVAPRVGLPQHRHVSGAAGAPCDAIEDALVLVLVTMLEPYLQDDPPAPSCPAAPACPTSLAPREEQEGEEGGPAAPIDPLRIEARAGPRLVWGLLPDTAAGAIAGFALAIDHFATGLDLSMLAPSTRRRDDARGVTVWAWLVGASACWRPLDDPLFVIDACARVEGGALDATGFGFELSLHTTDAWLDAGASASAALQLGPITLGLEAAILAALTTIEYARADGAMRESVYRSSPAIGSIGLWLRVPR